MQWNPPRARGFDRYASSACPDIPRGIRDFETILPRHRTDRFRAKLGKQRIVLAPMAAFEGPVETKNL